jgi:uncharacterized cysteine cluster protein YcgN (CxxCxxCC family)
MTLRHRFWERYPLDRLTGPEWEALCDGCGRCCLQKLEDADSGEMLFTRVSCRLLDTDTCRCGQYAVRRQLVPDCVILTPQTLERAVRWLPPTCAYKLLFQGQRLFPWHPLISGDADTVHEAGVSMRGRAVPEYTLAEDDWEDYPLEEEA